MRFRLSAVASSLFEDIATHGVAARPTHKSLELVEQLRAKDRKVHDPRCGAFADAIERVEAWRLMHDRLGGVPRETLEEIDATLRDAARMSLKRENNDWRTPLERIDLLVTGPDTWQKRGQARRINSE